MKMPTNRPRRFIVYTEGGRRHVATGPSLRTALRNFGKTHRPKSPVIAAVEGNCLAAPSDDALPFLAVILKNPAYTPQPLPL